jgi:hypothetical protein
VVWLGDENENHVLIRKGLKAGDVVWLTEPADAADLKFKGLEIYDEIKKEKEKQKEEAKKQAEKEQADRERQEMMQKQQADQQLPGATVSGSSGAKMRKGGNANQKRQR